MQVRGRLVNEFVRAKRSVVGGRISVIGAHPRIFTVFLNRYGTVLPKIDAFNLIFIYL